MYDIWMYYTYLSGHIVNALRSVHCHGQVLHGIVQRIFFDQNLRELVYKVEIPLWDAINNIVNI